MFLILGDTRDPWCISVAGVFEQRRLPHRLLANPLVRPADFHWHLDNERSVSLVMIDGETFSSADISGVFVRGSGWIDPEGWRPEDLAYMQSETQAALFAWLWSLECPVINRYPASIWYHPRKPLLLWYGLLRECGLPVPGVLLTNVPEAALDFGQGSSAEVNGAIYGPLTSDQRYVVSGDDWSRIIALQRVAPVSLALPHGEIHLTCVVEDEIIWDSHPDRELIDMETSIRSFAASAGLTFLEIAFATVGERLCVVSVEPFPRFERFNRAAKVRIVNEIADSMTKTVPKPLSAVSRRATT